MQTGTQRTMYLARRLAMLCSGTYSPEWGAEYAQRSLESPLTATTPEDAQIFGLPTDAYATPIGLTDMSLAGTLRKIAARAPDAYTSSQMHRLANSTLTMHLHEWSDWDRTVVEKFGGPHYSGPPLGPVQHRVAIGPPRKAPPTVAL